MKNKAPKYHTNTIHCPSCTKALQEQKIGIKEGIAFCRNCDYYFPIESMISKKRGKTRIKNLGDHINIRRLKNNEVLIDFRWSKNYNLIRVMMAAPDKYQSFIDGFGFLLNRTMIFVSRKYFKIEHKPFPDFIPMSYYTSSQIKNINVRPVENPTYWELNSKKYHGLYAELRNGEHVLILYDLHKTTLQLISQEINNVLRVE